MKRKGIVLAGGSGTRLHPITRSVSKQLLAVYDKPMIYYPICTLMLTGIREILIICTPRDVESFRELLGDGSKWGVRLQYEVQPEPGGIAQALIIGASFLNGSRVALVLGDNIFYGHGLPSLLKAADENHSEATIFAYHVSDPSRFGVVEFDESKKVLSIEEKPSSPKSNYAVTGLYFYGSEVCDFAASLRPSTRNELEITDINNMYLKRDSLSVELMGRGFAWLDTGTYDSLLEASAFISTLQKRQGLQVACPEEIAFNNGWITELELSSLARSSSKTAYGDYLNSLLKGML